MNFSPVNQFAVNDPDAIDFPPLPPPGTGTQYYGPFFVYGLNVGPPPISKSASASVVFSATAVKATGTQYYGPFLVYGLNLGPGPIHRQATATAVFTATAARSSGLTRRAAASAVFSASASVRQTRSGSGSVSVVFRAVASSVPARHYPESASALVVFRARARAKAPAVKFGDGYLGRYQVGRDVPLFVQCVGNGGGGAVPDGAPVARVYRGGVLTASVEVPAAADPDVTGRFRGRYTLGDGDGVGHYAVVYLYSVLGVQRSDAARFEVVPGGDPSGPVLASYTLGRPDGDFVLAHLGAGRVASGQTPYLDEGI